MISLLDDVTSLISIQIFIYRRSLYDTTNRPPFIISHDNIIYDKRLFYDDDNYYMCRICILYTHEASH